MKLFMLITFMLAANTVQAEIYKCETKNGKTVYQQTQCNNTKKQKAIIIHEFDQDRILQAQEKLSKELEQHREREATKKEQALKEREIKALEAQAKNTEELSDAARYNAYAIDRNTDAVNSRRQGNNYYPYYPSKHRRYNKKHPTYPNRQNQGVNATININ